MYSYTVNIYFLQGSVATDTSNKYYLLIIIIIIERISIKC